jgi:hypothetical protein
MPPDSTGFIQYLLNPSQWTLATIISIVLTAIGTVVAVISTVVAIRDARARRQQKQIQKIFKKEPVRNFFSSDAVERATSNYIQPDCSTDDPTQVKTEEEIDKLSRQPLFNVIDEFLSSSSPYHHLYILGDSGTGKTAFILNYFARNYKLPENQRYRLFIIPLGIPDVDQHIAAIEDKNLFVNFQNGWLSIYIVKARNVVQNGFTEKTSLRWHKNGRSNFLMNGNSACTHCLPEEMLLVIISLRIVRLWNISLLKNSSCLAMTRGERLGALS